MAGMLASYTPIFSLLRGTAFLLAASGLHARHLTAGDLRRHGREDDEGAGLIVALAVAAIALSLSAEF